MTNTPLTSKDYSNLLVFSLLVLPLLLTLVGIIPVIILIFGVWMTHRHRSIAHLEDAVSLFKRFNYLVIAISLPFSAYSIFGIVRTMSDTYRYRWEREEYFIILFLSIVCIAAALVYNRLVKNRLLEPISKHKKWIEKNGFSTKPNSENKDENISIIKGAGLRHYSVADELLKWSDLKNQGLITEEEFETAKNALLNKGA